MVIVGPVPRVARGQMKQHAEHKGRRDDPGQVRHPEQIVDASGEDRADRVADHARGDEEAQRECPAAMHGPGAGLAGDRRRRGVKDADADDAHDLQDDQLQKALGKADRADADRAHRQAKGPGNPSIVTVAKPGKERLEEAREDRRGHPHRRLLSPAQGEPILKHDHQRGDEHREHVHQRVAPNNHPVVVTRRARSSVALPCGGQERRAVPGITRAGFLGNDRFHGLQG